MSIADGSLLAFILIGAFSGYKQGFLMGLFSLVAILLGVLGGFKLMGYAMVFLADEFNVDQKVLPYLAFAVVFVVIVIAVKLLGKLLKVSINKSFLGNVDQASGAILGLVKAAFMLSVSLWIFDSLGFNLPKKWADDSWLLPKIESFAPQFTHWIGEYFPLFNDVLT